MEKLSRFVPKPILGLAARSLLAASLLGGCGVAPPESKTSSEGKTNSPQTSSLDDSNLHLPYWGLGYLTAGGGGDHVEHIDLASPQGGSCKDNPKLIIETWPVRAIMAGVVTEVGDENNLSDPNHSVVGIIHPNGLLSESEHLAKIKVKPGQQVKTGDELGFTSCEHRPTDFNTGPHVDLSIKRNGKTVSFDKEFPLSGWVQHSAKTNHDGTMTKDGQETRVANSNHCNDQNRNTTDCKNTINFIENNENLLVKNSADQLTSTATSTSTPTPSPTSTPRPTEIPQIDKKPTGANFKIGDSVEIYDTGAGGCLNIREKPAINSRLLGCLPDGTPLHIAGGPANSDTLNWWQLKEGNGWGVENYLRIKSADQAYKSFRSPAFPYQIDYPANWTPTSLKGGDSIYSTTTNGLIVQVGNEQIQPWITLEDYKNKLLNSLNGVAAKGSTIQTRFLPKTIDGKDGWMIEVSDHNYDFYHYTAVVVFIDKGFGWQINLIENISGGRKLELTIDEDKATFAKMLSTVRLLEQGQK